MVVWWICKRGMRSIGKPGKDLGKTTGWIHRQALKKSEVVFLSSVEYEKIDDAGLHISREGKEQVLEIDTIILCAGQVSNTKLFDSMSEVKNKHLIGGAHEARGIDAKRAIKEAYELALVL